ncbi:nuclear transport factor 2 family protein [Streptomyces canus]|uniref:nuclear transport factor 2 family protein n=1 Tax=Streptomyces canus TaxID=58343 RepID=UPI00036AF3C5|nr:nuclear transport factor 2 family protein [Streptomyces canus]
MSTTPIPDWFTKALEALRCGDSAGFLSMYADDAIHEVPLAPAGRPPELVGRAAIAEYAALLPTVARFTAFEDLRAHVSDDVLIVEFTGTGTRVGSDEPLRLAYVWFITHDCGRVSRIRDYTMSRP